MIKAVGREPDGNLNSRGHLPLAALQMPPGGAGQEQPHLGKLPERTALAPYLREDRTVARDGYGSWEGSRHRVHWQWGPWRTSWRQLPTSN